MGYRRVPVIHTIDDVPDEEGFIYRMKGISFGKVRQMIKLLDDEENKESVDEVAKRFVESLVSWNLEDEEGTPVPPTTEGVDDQDFDFILKLVNHWMDRLTGPDEDLGKDSSSGEKFPGQPLTMEAL